jgi:hypothetical protein
LKGIIMRKTVKGIVVSTAAVLGIATVGIGWAYFSQTTNASATGGGSANMSALVQGDASYSYDTPDGKLWPGHAADVRIPLTNNNAVPVEVKTVTAGSRSGNCAALALSATTWSVVDGNNASVADKQIPAGQTYTLVVEDGVALPDTAGNACQNQGFSSSWTITAENR